MEATLAVAILGLIAGLIFSTVSSQSLVGRTARADIEADQLARVALDRLVYDIERGLGPDQRGVDGPVLSGEPSGVGPLKGHTLRVLTRSPGLEPVIRAVYEVEADDSAGRAGDGDGLMVITRRRESLLGRPDDPGEVLCRRVAGFEIAYLTGADDEREDWTDAAPPKAVRVRLTVLDEEGRERVYERLIAPLIGLGWQGAR